MAFGFGDALKYGAMGPGMALTSLSGGGGLFGGNPNFGGMQDVISQRNSQIQEFKNQLEAARGNVLSNYQNLQTNTMNRFMPQFEASLAGRGLSPSGGAFASGVGQEAAKLQGGYDQMNANMTENNLNTIGQMQSNMFGPQFGLAEQQAMIPYQRQQAMMSALGGLAGTAAGAMMGGPGAAMGGQAGRSVFGGGQPGMGMNMPGFGGYGGFNGSTSSMRNPNMGLGQ